VGELRFFTTPTPPFTIQYSAFSPIKFQQQDVQRVFFSGIAAGLVLSREGMVEGQIQSDISAEEILALSVVFSVLLASRHSNDLPSNTT